MNTSKHNDADKVAMTRVDQIRCDGGTQTRVQILEEVVEEYAQAYQAQESIPPLILCWDGEHYWLVDGFHRLEAAKKAGLQEVRCEVQRGTCEDAVWEACAANARHGLRRTNEDKQRTVQVALRQPRAQEMTSRMIAKHCGVDHTMVDRYREQMESSGEIRQSATRVGLDGRRRSATRPRRQPEEVQAGAPKPKPKTNTRGEATAVTDAVLAGDPEPVEPDCTTTRPDALAMAPLEEAEAVDATDPPVAREQDEIPAEWVSDSEPILDAIWVAASRYPPDQRHEFVAYILCRAYELYEAYGGPPAEASQDAKGAGVAA